MFVQEEQENAKQACSNWLLTPCGVIVNVKSLAKINVDASLLLYPTTYTNVGLNSSMYM
jgi:hypothetical protein